MKKILFIGVAISILFFIACEDDAVIGDNENQVSRDYTWTIDTIQSGSIQTYMTAMWGSSSNNVWICGYNADNTKCLYFFDGNKWSPAIYPPTYFIKQFYDMGGSNSNNVYFVGTAAYINPLPPPNFLDSALVLQYSNGIWKYHDLSAAATINSFCLINENEIWAGGANGILLRYSGINWQQYYLDKEDVLINCVEALDANNVYASGHYEKIIIGQGAYLADYLYKFNGTQWTLIDSNIVSNNFNRTSYPTLIRNVNGNIFGSGDIGFVKMTGDTWEVIRPDIYGQFNGTNENNIFLANQNFGVLHYNGKDWYRFEELPWLSYYDVEVFNDAVFLLATNGNKSYIVRGKLNK